MNYLVAETFIQSGQLVEIGQDNPEFQARPEGQDFILSRADRWDQPLIRRYRRWLTDNLGSQFVSRKAVRGRS